MGDKGVGEGWYVKRFMGRDTMMTNHNELVLEYFTNPRYRIFGTLKINKPILHPSIGNHYLNLVLINQSQYLTLDPNDRLQKFSIITIPVLLIS